MVNDNNAAIVVNNLFKSFKAVKAVQGVSFEVSRGEIFGFLGPNGAGKTTTVEILAGLRSADTGSVSVHGVDVIKSPKKVHPHIGIQLQENGFFDALSVTEILRMFGSCYGYKVDTEAILGIVGLSGNIAKRNYKKMSGGQKQRFAIAVALVNDPPVVMLDEPSTGLDPSARRVLWEVVKGLKKAGKTVLLTTHYMDEAEYLCDRVAIFDQGKIVAADTPYNLIKALLGRGFEPKREILPATLEDVFLDLTGKELFTAEK